MKYLGNFIWDTSKASKTVLHHNFLPQKYLYRQTWQSNNPIITVELPKAFFPSSDDVKISQKSYSANLRLISLLWLYVTHMSHDGMCHRFKFLNKKICLNFKIFEKKNILQYVLEVGKVASDNSNLEIQICLNARVIFWTVFSMFRMYKLEWHRILHYNVIF